MPIQSLRVVKRKRKAHQVVFLKLVPRGDGTNVDLRVYYRNGDETGEVNGAVLLTIGIDSDRRLFATRSGIPASVRAALSIDTTETYLIRIIR